MQRLERIKTQYQAIKAFFKRYERWLMPVTLLTGFIVDYITFISIQISTALILLIVYWVVAALTVLFMHSYDAGKFGEKFKYLRIFAPLLIQFTFGGLLSNSFIFYWFSGSLWVSWPFILAFVILMISSDALRHYFLKPLVQLSVYFFATLSLVSVSLPFVFNSLEPKVFIFSSLISLVVFAAFVFLLGRVAGYIKFKSLQIFLLALFITLIMNIFYFTNIIPPVPLAVREAGVYHSVLRSGNNYILKIEKETFWQKVLPGNTIHLKQGERAYIFTAIFAPKQLNTTIFHHWQYYDEVKGGWMQKDSLSFNLTGGRKEGFRGYSYKSVLAVGKWRVYVKTSRGQTLGLVKFNVQNTQMPAEIIELVK